MRIIPRRLVSYSKADLKSVSGSFLAKNKTDKILEFETRFAEYIGVPHASAVSSVREGFSCLLDSLGLSQGDEIILAAYNYHVMPMLLKSKGLNPVFVDIDSETLNINSRMIEKKITPKTRGIVVTHLFGRAAEIQEIQTICMKHHLILIEDAAHACGAEKMGRKIGSFGDFGMFSFGTGKCLVTLGGGMIVCKDNERFLKFKEILDGVHGDYKRLKSYRYYLKSLLQITLTNRLLFALFVYPWLVLSNLFQFDPIERLTGDKYTPADARSKSKISPYTVFQAQLGLSQLARLDETNDRRIVKAKLLENLLTDIKEIGLIPIVENREHIALSFNIITPLKKAVRTHLLLRGIDSKESSMRNCAELLNDEESYPQMKLVDEKIIELPCSQFLSDEDIYYQANVIREYFGYPVMIKPGGVHEKI